MRAALALAVLGVAFAPSSCTTESGSGDSFIRGKIDALNCWSGDFDLKPDYFAAVPFARDDSLQIRIQSGGDFVSFSDGVFILIEKLGQARAQIKASPSQSLELAVSLPPEVTPPGVPIKPTSNPSLVHMSLYLQRSCHVQNVALYALGEVSLGPNGECVGEGAPVVSCPGSAVSVPTSDAGTAPDASVDDAAVASDAGDASTASDAGGLTVGRSTITFTKLFSGVPDERSADERLTEATFKVYLADPRDTCPGGLGPPPKCRGVLDGKFSFYFQRGRPAQPFP